MNDDEKICPYCAETIKKAAIICRYCNRDLAEPAILPAVANLESAHPLTAREEITYYKENIVTVTSTRAISGSKTYAMSNVTSVSLWQEPANYAVDCSVFFFGIIISGIAGVSDSTAGWIIFAVVCAIVVVIAMSQQPKFWIRVGSSSAEANAIWSHNRAYIEKIVAAVNKAIIERG